jgi:8-oxo-dGTP pyrophosphatase MutT (NUDIX family)
MPAEQPAVPGAPGPPAVPGAPADPDGPGAPAWLTRLARAAEQMPVPPTLTPPAGGGRHSAVLILFADGPSGPDVLIVQRGPGLRRHAGQPAFPGGAVDPEDDGPVAAALREAAEEALVDPAAVDVLAVLPDLFVWRSGFRVTPVLAWWRRPGPVGPGDPAEVTAVSRVPVADLVSPARRLTIGYPNGHSGPAFRAGDMLIWGFTGLVLDRLLALGGWTVPWDSGRITPLPPELLAPGASDEGNDRPARAGL